MKIFAGKMFVSRRSVRATSVLFVGLLAGGAAWAVGDTDRKNRPEKRHSIEIRDFRAQLQNSDCAYEAAAYASALATLDAAHDAADDAWEAWYLCEYGNGMKVNEHFAKHPTQPVKTASIIEK